MRLVALSTSIVLAVSGTAFAQASNNGQNNNGQTIDQGNAAQTTNSASQLPDQVKNELKQAGFSEVQVVPQSFLVQAKDPHGRPVMMLVHGNSIMAVTGYPGEGSGTTGSGSDSNSMPGDTGGQGSGPSNNSDSGK
jgi:hypothetical protein